MLHPYSSVPLIVAPTAMEYAAVHKALKLDLAAHKVRLVRCGVGETKSSALCQTLDASQISCLVLLGWAGGLVAGLPVGAVVCADKAMRGGQPARVCQPLALEASHTGPILTSPTLLLTPIEKQTAGADGALAVEMEAYPMAVWADQHSLPFMHARIIFDPLEETLPDSGSFQDDTGRLRLGALLKSISRQPGLLKMLVQLNQRVRTLDPALGKLAVDSLRAIFNFSATNPR